MSPEDWERMGWDARRRYVARLNRRDQATVEVRLSCPTCWANLDRSRDGGQWVRHAAQAIYDALPKEPEHVTAERLASLDVWFRR